MDIHKFLQGAKIIADKNPKYTFLSAEHDVIYLPIVELTEEEEKIMLLLGFRKEFEGWSAYC